MFFNLGPFSFGANQNQQRPPQPNNQGGFNSFLNDIFMNPFFPQQQQNMQHPEEEAPRPSFTRHKSRRESEKKEQKPKKEEIVYNENTGMYWKKKANEDFKNGNLQGALVNYNKAIELNNSQSVFFSNRARCLKKMGRLEQALKDAQEAVELEVDNIKGHLISGQILAEIGKNTRDMRKVENSIIRLKKALTLCFGQNKPVYFQNEISSYIYRAKKLHWYLKLQALKEKRIKAINNYKFYVEADSKLTEEEKEVKISEFIEATNQKIVFQIPDYLCCRITLELIEEPVVTDAGIVYEKSAIQEHIEKNGKTDPCSRKPISGTLYPCIPVKRAVEDFLEKNPWAYEFTEGESYHDIGF